MWYLYFNILLVLISKLCVFLGVISDIMRSASKVFKLDKSGVEVETKRVTVGSNIGHIQVLPWKALEPQLLREPFVVPNL